MFTITWFLLISFAFSIFLSFTTFQRCFISFSFNCRDACLPPCLPLWKIPSAGTWSSMTCLRLGDCSRTDSLSLPETKLSLGVAWTFHGGHKCTRGRWEPYIGPRTAHFIYSVIADRGEVLSKHACLSPCKMVAWRQLSDQLLWEPTVPAGLGQVGRENGWLKPHREPLNYMEMSLEIMWEWVSLPEFSS